MAQVNVGELRVQIGADSRQLDTSLRDATSSFRTFSNQVASIAAGIGLERLLTKAVEGFVRSIKKGFAEADKLGKAAEKVGIPVEQLSLLSRAADEADVSMDTLTRSLGIFSRHMAEAVREPTSEAARAFQALGISVTDSSGRIRQTLPALLEAADRFSIYEDGANKAALGNAIFGRSWQELVPLLNQGKKGIQDTMQVYKDLGLEISQKTAVAADAFRDNLVRLGAVWDAVFLKMAAALSGPLANFTNSLVEWAREGGVVDRTFNAIAGTAKLVYDNLSIVASVLLSIIAFNVITGLASLAVGMRALAIALKEAEVAAALFAVVMKPMRALIIAIGAAAIYAMGGFEAAQAAFEKILGVVSEGVTKFTETDALFNQMGQTLETLTMKLTNTGMEWLGLLDIIRMTGEIADMRLAAPGIAAANAYKGLGDEIKKSQAAMRAWLDELLDSNWVTFPDKIKAIELAQERMAIGAEEAGRRQRQLKKEMQDQFLELATLTGSTLTKIFKDSKAAAIAEAIINTAVAITKALTGFTPPISFAMAALHAAAGAAQIATIRSTTPGGGGAAPGVRGGAAAAAPAAAAAAATQRPTPGTLTVQGVSTSMLYTGDVVRALAERLLQYQRDGGNVVLQ